MLNKILLIKNAWLYFALSYFLMFSFYISLLPFVPLAMTENKFKSHETVNLDIFKLDKEKLKEIGKSIIAFILFPIIFPIVVAIYMLAKIGVAILGTFGGLLFAVLIPIFCLVLLIKYIVRRIRT